MSNQFDGLQVASSLDGTESIPLVQGGDLVRTTAQEIADIITETTYTEKLFVGNTTSNNLSGSVNGTIVNGEATDTATMATTNVGTLISGRLTGNSGAFTASGIGTYILGSGILNATTNTPALVTTSNNGAGFLGFSSGGTAVASGLGSLVQGCLSRNGVMTASGTGAAVIGYVTASSAISGSGIMTSSGLGSMARGSSQDGGSIIASAQGAFASGRASGPNVGSSNLTATAQGAHTLGNAETGGDLTNAGAASLLIGQAEMDSTISITGGHGSIAMGHATAGGTITTSANGSFVGGYVSGDTISNSGQASFLWGKGISNTVANTFKVGWGSDSFVVQGNNVSAPNIPEYANRTAALGGGLTAGMLYSLPISGDNKVICIV